MKKHYLFFASLTYAYSILRPLQEEIRRRGDIAAWYLEDSCPDLLEKDEIRLKTFDEVFDFNPIAVFAPGNWIYDFFPGVKVEVFHGYPINKRGDEKDDHFAVRGWFDLYCTQGETSTLPYKEKEVQYKFFKVYETGWCKVDAFFNPSKQTSRHTRPMILYSTTFTKSITSAPCLFDTIEHMARTRDWEWILSFHPKFDDETVLAAYRNLAASCPNVTFNEGGVIDAALLNSADVLLSDASSIIVEFMLQDKPVVTFCNTVPGKHLLNVTETDAVEEAIEKALSRPEALMEQVRAYTYKHERHRDGKNSARVLDAVDDFIASYQGRIKSKPLNLFRKLKLRWRLKYFKW